MNKLKYLSILFLASIILSGCKKRDTFENNVFFDKTFNWEIAIPDDYEKVNLNGKEEKSAILLIEKKNAIVAFKRDDSNYFSANYEDYNEGDGQSLDLNMRLKDFLLLKKLGQIYPRGKMGDYSVTNENISGLKFRKAKISIIEKGKTAATVVLFSSVFTDKIFTATIVYEDEDYGNAIIDLFQKSTFKQ